MKKNQAVEKAIIKTTQNFLIESGHKQAYRTVTLQKSLTYDLGIGSIERVELMQRLEQTFSVQLEENFIARIDNLEAIYQEIINKLEREQPDYHFVDHIADLPKIDMSSAQSLVDILLLGKQQDSKRTWLYLQNTDGKETTLSYQALYDKAMIMAYQLKEKGLQPGDEVAIMLPTSCEFFYAFFAVLLLGAIPLVIPPSAISNKKKQGLSFLLDEKIKFLISNDNLRPHIESKKITFLSSKELLKGKNKDQEIYPSKESDIAITLFTAGTTGEPKETPLSHRSILTNIKSSIGALNISPSDIVVNWLPLNNDISLITMCLTSLYAGIPLVLIDHNDFLQQPERWLWAIHFHQGTISAASDFDLIQCIQKIKPHTLDGLDISNWRVALITADQAQPHTLDAFAQKFSPYGLKETCLTPAYGLTENVALLTVNNPKQKYLTDRVDLNILLKENIAQKTNTDLSIEYVSCGKALVNNKIRIVDDNNAALKDRHIGKIQFCRLLSPENSAEKWISSGDYGYTVEENLFVIGREQGLLHLKENKQCYAKVIENLVNMLPDISTSSAAAFNDQKKESYVLAVEISSKSTKRHSKIRKTIFRKLKTLNLPTPGKVIFVKNNTLPRAISGKIKRFQCQKYYVNNQLGKKASPSWLQIIRAQAKKLLKSWAKKTNLILKVIYTIYTLLIAILTGLPAWTIIICVPRKIGVKILKLWCKFLFVSMLCPIKYTEESDVDHSKTPIVYTANHTGYLDILVLIAVLPSGISYIGKQELASIGFLKKLMKHLGYIFVNPVDFTKTPDEIKKIIGTVNSGRSVLIFAEGTLTYATGLRPFKMGTFKVATETNAPVCPVSIQGVRTILRDGSYLFRPDIIKVHVSSLIYPTENSWKESLRLRDEAYKAIADNCGEKTINLIAAGPPLKEKK